MKTEQVALHLNKPHTITNVTWNMTMKCNLDCSYCVRDIRHDSTSHAPPLDKMKLMVDIVHNQFETIDWGITGGEPMTIPHIGDIVEYMESKKGSMTSIVTNGMFPFSAFKKVLDKGLRSLVISVHYEYIFGKEKQYIQLYKEINDYINLLNSQLTENKKKLIIRIMIYPGCFAEHIKMAEQLKELGITNIEFRPLGLLISKVYRGIPVLTTKERIAEKYNNTPHAFLKEAMERTGWYTTEEQEQYSSIMKKDSDKTLKVWYADNTNEAIHYNELLLNLRNMFEGWNCYLGKQLIIDFNGDIYRSNCQVEGPVGNINTITETYVIPQNVYLCNKEYCNDYCDLQIPKAKLGYEQLIKKELN